MAAADLPGLALAITHHHAVLHVQGYGTASKGQPVTPQTQFLLGSLSKSFTALAVMQLVEAGSIDLDAPVQTYLPEFTLAEPTIAAQITIRHLLNQVSGLSDLGFPELRLSQATTIRDRVTSLGKARPLTSPGTQFHYFNPNYEVLARVVEVISQQPFSIYLQTHIFMPLQMSQTLNVITTSEALQQATHLAQGHLMAFGIPVATPELSGYLGGSSGVISTAEDMAHYLILQTNAGRFRDTNLLSAKDMTLMHTPPPNISSAYGMGWFNTIEKGQPAWEHNGILSTFYAEVVLLPQAQYGIALLYNISALPLIALALPQIKTGLIQILMDEQPVSSGLSMINLWNITTALLLLIAVVLAIRRLLHLPQWQQAMRRTSPERLWLKIGWAFLPAIVLLAMPWLIALVSDRFFGYGLLWRSMLDIMIWLSVCAGLGALTGITQIVFLLQNRRC
jgi:CubicO group peptidase (beta-lactamase class C family)